MIGIMLIGFHIVHDQPAVSDEQDRAFARLQQMKHAISYKNYLIRGESFQPTQSSGWIPRYVLQRELPNAEADPSPLAHDRLDKAFGSETEVGEFAVRDAKSWIDNS